MIHLVGGESALGTLKETSVPGEKFSIDDILMEGPVLDGLRSESSWNARADYLDRYFSIPKFAYLSGNAERNRVLHESLLHEEIVLWFEFDLFCQANLLYFLDWYASRDLGQTRLTLICPETVPGRARFRGLGELRTDELESLFPERSEITADQKRLAQLAWQAYGSNDPRAIEAFLQSSASALPLLAPALRAHLERFPSIANGLGILGQKTLEILVQQPADFHEVFRRLLPCEKSFDTESVTVSLRHISTCGRQRRHLSSKITGLWKSRSPAAVSLIIASTRFKSTVWISGTAASTSPPAISGDGTRSVKSWREWANNRHLCLFRVKEEK